MLEAVNENRTGCFGWAVEQLYDNEKSITKLVPSRSNRTHHHQNKRNFVGKPNEVSFSDKTVADPTPPGDRSWTWFPSPTELRTHYIHSLGFLACSAQMFGATVFWIAGITALPPIFNSLTTTAKLNGAYWAPQIIGGSGFVVSGMLFMLETQGRWWKPALGVLGWHIGFWNLIGGIGFTICPIFGLYTAHWAQEQASLSTFWGTYCFPVIACCCSRLSLLTVCTRFLGVLHRLRRAVVRELRQASCREGKR